jgi:hypothetical protein
MRQRGQRELRRRDVKARAGTPNEEFGSCRVLGCGKPARAATTDGLDMRYCRSHYEHLQSHGNPFKGSYRAKDLNPYRQAALQWLVEHEDEYWAKHATSNVSGLYRRAGAHVEAFRLTGLTPRERAKAHWARLRVHEVDPRLPVAAWIAVEMIVRDDPQSDGRRDYKLVQAAKLVHRMASGSHRKWVREYSFGTHTEELHVYPRPRGRVLRSIGGDLETASELLVDHHLADIQAFKRERDQLGKFNSSPYPRRWSAKRTSS